MATDQTAVSAQRDDGSTTNVSIVYWSRAARRLGCCVPNRRSVGRAGYQVKPLSPDTWPAFVDLVERHNGVWGGCWCIGFHPEGAQRGTDHRAMKERRVRDGEAHAALVFDGKACVGWCQFGSPEE